MNNDPYDTGTPKYKTAQSIYDGLCELTQTEEMSILSEMFSNVSYEGQEYYYTDKGNDLKDKFEELSGYGDKMWILDLAIFQIDEDEIHDIVYEALYNSDLAKRLDFKKLFVEHMLRGDKAHYNEIAEEYLAELQEMNRFYFQGMVGSFIKVMQARGREFYIQPPYGNFCHALGTKARNLHLHKETKLIVECRALLTSYDDFMLGLRMNQALYEAQERQYKEKVAQLHASYEEKVRQLYLTAEKNGLVLDAIESERLLHIRHTSSL